MIIAGHINKFKGFEYGALLNQRGENLRSRLSSTIIHNVARYLLEAIIFLAPNSPKDNSHSPHTKGCHS
jgi:hypothetical protein